MFKPPPIETYDCVSAQSTIHNYPARLDDVAYAQGMPRLMHEMLEDFFIFISGILIMLKLIS